MDTQLKTFLCVCETLNFTRAAQQLFLTQPAVSQHIQALEKRYGQPLFCRRAGPLQRMPVSCRTTKPCWRKRCRTAITAPIGSHSASP